MIDLIRIALRYLIHQWAKTLILVFAIALILFLPVALHLLVQHGSESLVARAKNTPLLIGSKASPLELVLNTLYFESKHPPEIAYGEVERVQQSGWAEAIPLYSRFSARGVPIIGTNGDYFRLRNLSFASGRQPTVIGECVLGSGIAKRLGLSEGDSVFSSPEEVFDLAGVYPLKMVVVGVLEATGGPDDHIILTDVKTTWIIGGHAHGHEDLSQAEDQSAILSVRDKHIVASSALVTYNEITDENRNSYHFHGDIRQMPITAVLANPYSPKSATLLQGSYLDPYEQVQVVDPKHVIKELLNTVLAIQRYLMIGAAVAVGSMLLTATLVFMLSIRLRKREIETMHRIGVSSNQVRAMLTIEIGLIILFSFTLAALIAVAFTSYIDALVRSLFSIL